ncbi:MAG: RecQ family ATP-dependent DNA helicase, partial [Bacteroidota bacterium]
MANVLFFDTEIDATKGKLLDIGCITSAGQQFHRNSLADFHQYVESTEFLCGHNILRYDLPQLEKITQFRFDYSVAIDTLFLSPLLFPSKPYHRLVKDDKLNTEDLSNPLNDAIKAKELFHEEINAYNRLDSRLKALYRKLLFERQEFHAFFRFLKEGDHPSSAESLIREIYANNICSNVDLNQLIADSSIALAYALSLINAENHHSISPRWVLKSYPDTEKAIFLLRNNPCLEGCPYCRQKLDGLKALKQHFGYSSFRSYDNKPLQQYAVEAAIKNQSLLAVFPTGGGKSLTFQIPALMSGEAVKGLTVVISPLQSLMKDQVDNLEKSGITAAVTINGLLDPLERSKSFERVEDGSATILYISPESLRSRTIERLLLGRKIVRFVIDEAHCFSSWGQDFRVDYLYIADFIKSLQDKKNLAEHIPVSCFTATAKQKVIADIRKYFHKNLGLDLQVFEASSSRNNLHYNVLPKADDNEKYQSLRNLIEAKDCPTIVYVSRTRRASDLAERLATEGYSARSFHGKMDKAEKARNQDAFISGEIQVMVATSAFGMGVDKKDVGLVVHYEISDSLENYVQEAGRAGRDQQLDADCYILFNEDDLDKHFTLLNQNKLQIKEIQQIWKAIKEITRFHDEVSQSALEIARKAGWDENVMDIETRVTTAIAALEDAGYLKRGQNMPRIFANSIRTRNAQDAIDQINASKRFNDQERENAIRIIRKLVASGSRKEREETAESRIDYIADHLGIVKKEVINAINLLREEKILGDKKDLTAFIRRSDNENKSLQVIRVYQRIENFLLTQFNEEGGSYNIKSLNELALAAGCAGANPQKIRKILNFWSIKHLARHKNHYLSDRQSVIVQLSHSTAKLKEQIKKRHELSSFIVSYLFERNQQDTNPDNKQQLVEFSVHEIKKVYEKADSLFKLEISIADVEDTLLFLSRMEAILIEGGFMVVYNKLSLERLVKDNKKRYKVDDYQQLSDFYSNKVQQIHIVGEYAKKMLQDYKEALTFVEDYFTLNYSSFLQKYFKGSRRGEIQRNLTPAKFQQLFGNLSPTQLNIIKDSESDRIAVLAGPGSGKTRVLVHKLASLLKMEDVKHEQLLMLTFSRAAATEFKERLITLIGNAA